MSPEIEQLTVQTQFLSLEFVFAWWGQRVDVKAKRWTISADHSAAVKKGRPSDCGARKHVGDFFD